MSSAAPSGVEGFRDDEFDYQLIRAMGVADYGGSTVGECLAVVAEITDGSPTELGPGLRAPGPSGGGAGTGVPGGGPPGQCEATTCSGPRPTTGRPSTTPDGVTGGSNADGGAAAGPASPSPPTLRDPPVEAVEVPFEGGSLPGYLVRPAAATGGRVPRRPPTLVGRGEGFDSSAEELYFHLGVPGAERGWNVFVFDGPGQPGCMRGEPAA